jgi:hypothetical protein
MDGASAHRMTIANSFMLAYDHSLRGAVVLVFLLLILLCVALFFGALAGRDWRWIVGWVHYAGAIAACIYWEVERSGDAIALVMGVLFFVSPLALAAACGAISANRILKLRGKEPFGETKAVYGFASVALAGCLTVGLVFNLKL